MATINYNEYTHTAGVDVDSMDPLYKWDTHFPERMSRLHMEELGPSSPGSKNARRNRRNRNRNTARFKTQPITFDEIKEVDEDRVDDEAKKDLKNQFAAFSRSMDGILPVSKKEARAKKSAAQDTAAAACLAAEASGPAEEPAKANPADTSFHGSMPSSSAAQASSASASAGAASSLTTADGIPLENLPQYDAARQARRQKRRHKKSITDVTEVTEEDEKTNGAQSGST